MLGEEQERLDSLLSDSSSDESDQESGEQSNSESSEDERVIKYTSLNEKLSYEIERKQDKPKEFLDPNYLRKPFKTGQICRIKLKDFITYSDVEFFPDPGMNLVVGPNGTGKSTILCAIVIGLGGKPKDIGTVSKVSGYIKHGKETATIEIELFDESKPKNVVVSRIIHQDNKSVFTINGKKSSQQVVNETMLDMNIRIGNLCQFLPQHKLPEFVKINLLVEVEKALSKDILYSAHAELIEKSKKIRSLKKDFLIKKRDVSSIDFKLKNYKLNIDSFRLHRVYQKRLLYLSLLAMVQKHREKLPLYRMHRSNIEKLETLIHKMFAVKNLYDERASYLGNRVKSASIETEQLRIKYKKSGTLLQKLLSRNLAQLNEIASIRNDVGDQINELQKNSLIIKQIESKRQQVLDEYNTIQSMKIDEICQASFATEWDFDISPELLDKSYSSQLKSHIKHVNTKLADIREKRHKIHKKIDSYELEINQCRLELQDYNRDLSLTAHGSSSSPESQRLHMLFSLNTNYSNTAKRATAVFNRNKHIFSNPENVRGPISRYIVCKDNQIAKYLIESSTKQLPFAFTVRTKEDHIKLEKLFRQNKCPTQIISVTQQAIKEANRKMERQPGRGNMEYLKKFGVSGWLSDFVETDEWIMSILVNFHKIHAIAVVAKDLSPHQLDKILQKESEDQNGAKTLYSPTTAYRVTHSSYRKKAVIRTQNMKNLPLAFFPKSSEIVRSEDSKEQHSSLQKNINSLQKKMADLDGRKKKVHESIIDLKKQIRMLDKYKETLSQNENQIRRCRHALNNHNKRLEYYRRTSEKSSNPLQCLRPNVRKFMKVVDHVFYSNYDEEKVFAELSKSVVNREKGLYDSVFALGCDSQIIEKFGELLPRVTSFLRESWKTAHQECSVIETELQTLHKGILAGKEQYSRQLDLWKKEDESYGLSEVSNTLELDSDGFLIVDDKFDFDLDSKVDPLSQDVPSWITDEDLQNLPSLELKYKSKVLSYEQDTMSSEETKQDFVQYLALRKEFTSKTTELDEILQQYETLSMEIEDLDLKKWRPLLVCVVQQIDKAFKNFFSQMRLKGEVNLVTDTGIGINNYNSVQQIRQLGKRKKEVRPRVVQKRRSIFSQSQISQSQEEPEEKKESSGSEPLNESVNDIRKQRMETIESEFDKIPKYENFSLQVLVSFQQNTPLVPFTSGISGGERAVTTMLFVMSLQNVSDFSDIQYIPDLQNVEEVLQKDFYIPFRCVDEINQGMDEKNERDVLNLIFQSLRPLNTSKSGEKENLGMAEMLNMSGKMVKSSKTQSAPQYFMITPKLLPNMLYSEYCSVLCVFNGYWALKQEEWNQSNEMIQHIAYHGKRNHPEEFLIANNFLRDVNALIADIEQKFKDVYEDKIGPTDSE